MQALVIGVTVNHFVLEVFEPFHLHAIYFLPASLYLFPVLYASLNFGTRGAIPTALWSAVLALPNVVFLHDGMERVGESFQVVAMLVLGTMVALRIEKERVARETAEAAEQERRASELKYRSLFDGASEAIVVIDQRGVIREANAAAVALVRHAGSDPRNTPLVDMLGPQAQPILRRLPDDTGRSDDLCVRTPEGADLWLEPRLTRVSSGGEMLTQVLLRDVTDRRGFQHYAQEVVKAQERERQWIAQELHDVSVQSAILICRRLDAASDAAEEERRDEIVQKLSEARTMAENMADELRRFSRDLRPLILEDLGLVPALKRLITEIQSRTKMNVRFDVVGRRRRLDSAVELAVFRIAQESLRNAERHSRATEVTVTLAIGPQAIHLCVRDNGKGFEVPGLTTLAQHGELGLLGMQERAVLVGGCCEIQSRAGCGTSVTADVPTMPQPTKESREEQAQ